MKRSALVFAALAVLVLAALPAVGAGSRDLDVSGAVKSLNGVPTYLGTICTQDAGTANNWTTTLPDAGAAAPFDAGSGGLLLVQCIQPTRLEFGSSGTSAGLRGVRVDTDEKFYCLLKSTQNAVAIRPVSGATAYCDVFKVE